MPKLIAGQKAQGPKAVKDRPIVYPTLTVNGIPIPEDKMRLGWDQLKDILGWEDEDEYRRRVAGPNGDPETVAGYGDAYLLVDEYGKKVRCHNNLNNRPFDEATAKKYAQDVLNMKWAGPRAFPGETVNGETIIVGRTGQVESGQHRGVGGMLAIQKWRQNPGAYPKWKEEPYLESLVVFGVSEDSVIVRTLDNVRPRTLADTIYTSPIFASLKTDEERKECSRMLDAAIDLLWKRTNAGEDPRHKYQTHSSSFDFLDRHGGKNGHLVSAVKHVHEENAERGISLLRVPAGAMAGAMYLMGSAASDPDEYLRDRKESRLDWKFWDKANDFIATLANGEDKDLEALRVALGELIDTDEGMGGRLVEKLAVLAAAWGKVDEKGRPMDGFIAGEPVKAKQLKLSYVLNDAGVPIDISDPATFGGIDMGPKPTGAEPAEGDKDKEVEEAKQKRKAKEKADADKLAKASGVDPVQELVENTRAQNKGRMLLFSQTGATVLYGVDAETAAKVLERKFVKRQQSGYPQLGIPDAELNEVCAKLRVAGHKLARADVDDKGGVKVTDLPAPFAGAQPREKGKPAPPTPSVQGNGQAVKKPANPQPAKPKLKGGV